MTTATTWAESRQMAESEIESEETWEQNFIDHTSLHGIGQIANNKRPAWLRVFWILAFCVCLGVGLWQISTRIQEYLDYDVNTKITRVYRNELEFPAITVCNFNRYLASQVTDEDWPYLEYALFAEEYDYDSYADDSQFERSQFDYYTLFWNTTFNFTEFTRRAGFQLDDTTLLECKWRGRNCYAENFTHVFTSYGNCWTFNSGKDKDGNFDFDNIFQEDQPGAGNGLRMIINIHQGEYTETLTGNVQAGLKILAHDQEDPPLMDAQGFAIAPGYYSFVGLRRNEFHNLWNPWGECDRDRTLEYYPAYTLSACFLECRLNLILDECFCRPVRYPGNADVCTPLQSATCVKDVLTRFQQGSLGTCDCPVPCFYTEFSSVVSYAAFPSASVANATSQEYGFDAEYIANNIAIVDIFYDELNFQRFEEKKAMTISGLISDIGGNLGLFIGASILTFAEFLDYLLNKSLQLCGSKRRTRRTQEAPPLKKKVRQDDSMEL